MKKINILTVILALFWSLIIVSATLSPFAYSVGTQNQTGDMGMWSGIGVILILFFFPLYFYNHGSNGAKIALSIIIGIFILGSIALSGLAFLFLVKGFSFSLVLIVILGILYIVFSIAWYAFLFKMH